MGLRGDLTTFLFSHTRLKFAVLLIIKTLVKRGGGVRGRQGCGQVVREASGGGGAEGQIKTRRKTKTLQEGVGFRGREGLGLLP